MFELSEPKKQGDDKEEMAESKDCYESNKHEESNQKAR